MTVKLARDLAIDRKLIVATLSLLSALVAE
jgi:hypothetical protein